MKREEEERLRKEEEERLKREAEAILECDEIEHDRTLDPYDSRLSVFSRELVSLCGEVRKINQSLNRNNTKNMPLEEVEEMSDDDLVRLFNISL